MRQQHVAAEAEASAPDLRRWVCIYPYQESPVNTEPYLFAVYDFELPTAEMAEYEGDEDLIMTSRRRYYLNSIAELDALLEKLAVTPALFDAPWRADYPL
ncbi:hypothetical protein [Hymenobacter coalescens]